VRILQKSNGEHFDPQIIELFLGNMDEVVEIQNEINSNGYC